MSTLTLHAAASGFESARRLGGADGHPSRQPHTEGVHGHSFVTRIRTALDAPWAPYAGGPAQELAQRLHDCTARLDRRWLNDVVPRPTDEHLARWLREQLELPGLDRVSVQSTTRQGVDLDRHGHAHLWRRHRLESAHWLPHVAPGHKCGRLHGHGFEVTLHANRGAQAAASQMDLAQLDAAWAPLHARLHHRCLNDIHGLDNPTSERIAAWLWQELQSALPALSGVTVQETASCGAHFNGRHFRIWKDLSLDSAVRLKHAPPGSALAGVHGHTHTLRLHLAAPLEPVMGWTVDFGDVKELFTPIFQRLDHHALHEIAELPDCDPATLAHWILQQAQGVLPAVDRVDLYDTPETGALALAGAQALNGPL